ncbi:MAG: DegT/DnrJ/EryC1/StrS aminotransferase family protein, partial [Methanobacteriaceae archaeon]|nr:DegT/DnrJ/EryC1/StrS aminotransferase family protein [Methanobacteriaceae archaeon]
PDKRGINVIFRNDNAKELSWKLRDSFDVEGRGIITRCPNYNRLKIKGIALEVKNLDVKCLTKNNLKSIIDIINNINE